MTTVITNSIITVNVQTTASATIKLLKAAGAKIGKTSAADLLAGRKEIACGFQVKTVEVKAPATNKASIARNIFNEMFGTDVKPAQIKARMMAEAGLSKHGANTYYYKMKSAANKAA